MNIHQTLDNHSSIIGSLILGKQKYFSRSIDACGFKKIFQNINIDFPKIEGEGQYELKAWIGGLRLDPAFLVYKWKGNNFPTLIYNHGNNEKIFDFGIIAKNSFKKIFLERNKVPECNIILIRAPFHNSSLGEYKNHISSLFDFMSMISTAALVAEKIICFINENIKSTTAVCGISLGGWVANLHRTYFNTADLYIPLLAGAELSDVFLRSSYSKLTGEKGLNKQDVIEKYLNFEKDFKKIKSKNIFSLLARHDQFIRIGVQKPCYGKNPVQIIQKGHVSSLLAPTDISNHIIKVLGI